MKPEGNMSVFAAFVFLAAIVFVQGASDGYVLDKSSGKMYKLMYQSQTWSNAREICEREGAKLAVPKTKDEFKFIQKQVRGMYYPNITGTTYKLIVWIGINNLDNYRVWKNLDGENIVDTGFHTWSGQNGIGFSDDPKEPHCGGMDASNPGLRDWWCHRQQPFVCEKQADELSN